MVQVARPPAASGRVVVQVLAASINPGEASIRQGLLHERWPASFPEGEGSDFAGLIEEIGEGVTAVSVGDEVIGWSEERSSHAEYVSVPASQVVPKPAGVPWTVAGSLYVAGITAWATIRAVDLKTGDTVAVSAAAGGVGSVVVQLARHVGATVIGIAGASNSEWLSSRGAIPVVYGDGVTERLRAAAPAGIDAFIDCFGDGYVEIALELGVPVGRIDTIIDWAGAAKIGAEDCRTCNDRGSCRGPVRIGRSCRRGRDRSADRAHVSIESRAGCLCRTRTASHPRQDRPRSVSQRIANSPLVGRSAGFCGGRPGACLSFGVRRVGGTRRP